MRRHSIIAICALFLSTAVASAAPGYSTADVNMRAGPSTANPVVTTIPQGSPVQIVGCLAGWSWCDTLWAGYRGQCPVSKVRNALQRILIRTLET